MTMESLPTILFQVTPDRTWYKNDTISVDKTGINGTIIEVGSGGSTDTTILVDKTGLIATTTDLT